MVQVNNDGFDQMLALFSINDVNIIFMEGHSSYRKMHSVQPGRGPVEICVHK
uniref:Uncharacterized protein n=1 Tax=Glossina morsitans morsitans TaxID=37546 RepID=A0A1B0FMK6_GLOMM